MNSNNYLKRLLKEKEKELVLGFNLDSKEIEDKVNKELRKEPAYLLGLIEGLEQNKKFYEKVISDNCKVCEKDYEKGLREGREGSEKGVIDMIDYRIKDYGELCKNVTDSWHIFTRISELKLLKYELEEGFKHGKE